MSDYSKMTKQELMALLAEQDKQEALGYKVKKSDKEGSDNVSIISKNFVAYSTKRQKNYNAVINMPLSVAKALFNAPQDALESIKEQVNKLN